MPEATDFVRPSRLLYVGAHPDDADLGCGGTAIRLLREGRQVMFVSMTNGNSGHMSQSGGTLARRRAEEARRVGEFLGLRYLVLDNEDGELVATLENRRRLITMIREYQPTVIVTHRLNDYHADHRNTSLLVQDAAYLVAVPNICSMTPCLSYNPVILYSEDSFQKPTRFTPDLIVDITQVFEMKMQMLTFHESQFFEWLPYVDHLEKEVPTGAKERIDWLKQHWGIRTRADRYRELLQAALPSGAKTPEHVESFEISEYGGRVSADNIGALLPTGSLLIGESRNP